MAWAIRASAVLAADAAAPGTSWNPGSLGAAVQLGDTIFVVVQVECDSGDTNFPNWTCTGVSDQLGNTYVKDGGVNYGDGTTGQIDKSVWRAVVTNTGTPSITVTRSNAPAISRSIGMAAAAFSGLNLSAGAGAALDISKLVGNISGSVVSTYDSGTTVATTGAANELKIGFGSDTGEGSTLSPGTLDTTYTQAAKADSNGHAQILLEYADSGAVGSTARATVGTSAFGGGDWWDAGVLVYKLAGGAAGPVGRALEVNQARSRGAFF